MEVFDVSGTGICSDNETLIDDLTETLGMTVGSGIAQLVGNDIGTRVLMTREVVVAGHILTSGWQLVIVTITVE